MKTLFERGDHVTVKGFNKKMIVQSASSFSDSPSDQYLFCGWFDEQGRWVSERFRSDIIEHLITYKVTVQTGPKRPLYWKA